jgi:hypothetical protein
MEWVMDPMCTPIFIAIVASPLAGCAVGLGPRAVQDARSAKSYRERRERHKAPCQGALPCSYWAAGNPRAHPRRTQPNFASRHRHRSSAMSVHIYNKGA